MTTVQINLPDELTQKAASAGLLSAEAMEAMLREQRRRRGGEALQAMWQREPQQELTPEIEQEIAQQVVAAAADVRQELPVLGRAGGHLVGVQQLGEADAQAATD